MLYLEHTPSARTSVGNKEYEYKGKKEVAAQPQQAVNRWRAGPFGDAGGGVALRHVIDPNGGCQGVSTVSSVMIEKSLLDHIWTSRWLDAMRTRLFVVISWSLVHRGKAWKSDHSY
ncbi:hypothetical protein [Dyella sp. 2RAB6]|uniref:hypothetical protein n=1 Tax=Dyella sp. 2RAB6 TaxID=3232992 RepID=UPI003F8F758A